MFPSQPPLATGRIEDYREVAVIFTDFSRGAYIMHKNDVGQFTEATVKLHHAPGCNPYTGGTTAKICRILSRRLILSGPYWWTAPSLKAEGPGARFVEGSFDDGEVLWEDKAFLEEHERREMLAEGLFE